MGNKKIYAFWNIFILSFLLLFFLTVLTIEVMNDIQIDDISFSTAMLLSGTIAIIALLGLKTHCLTIDLENKRASFFARGFGSWKTVKKDEWNYNVYLPDIQTIEIVKLSKEERKKNLGSKYLFHKYLKIKVSKNGYKYIYISLFTKKQINNIISLFNKSVKPERKY